MTAVTSCHRCDHPMCEVESELATTAPRKRATVPRPAAHQRFRCPQCGATRVSARLVVDGAPFSFDPFDNYIAAAAYQSELNDDENFRLRLSAAKKE